MPISMPITGYMVAYSNMPVAMPITGYNFIDISSDLWNFQLRDFYSEISRGVSWEFSGCV